MVNVVDSTDFTLNALADNGVTVTRTPITVTYTSNGDEILTEGTPEDITAIFHYRKKEYDQTNQGLMTTRSAYIMTGPSQTLNKGDKITYGGESYKILNVVVRGPSGDIAFYKYADLVEFQ